MKKVVMKFGGTSIDNSEKIKHVANLVRNYHRQNCSIVVVVSALRGVTDELLEASNIKEENLLQVAKFSKRIYERHVKNCAGAIVTKGRLEKTKRELTNIIGELEKVLTGIVYLGELTPKSRDLILSFGERLAAAIIQAALKDVGLNAQQYTGKEVGIVTNSNYGEATPLMNVSQHQIKERIEPLWKKGIVPVITGFIAATQDGAITTLGRGGSDYTATIIGAALDVDEIWIWTDVDGLMTSDPKIVSSAKVISEISFQEAKEMTMFRAKGMHPRALEPALNRKIAVRIRNVFNPDNPGTRIVEKQRVKPKDVVKAVVLTRDVALVNVGGFGMMGVPGTAAKVFNVIGKENINILMISQSVSEANISFILYKDKLATAMNLLEIALLGNGIIREVTAEDDVCVVSVVGAGMKGTPGVGARIFKAVSERGINVRMIAQGSSELNISFVVREGEGGKAVRAIHEEFRLDQS